VIALEGHGLGSVVADAVGSIRARVAVSGPGGHAWIDRNHPSAIHALIALAAQTLEGGEPDSPVNIGLIDGGIAVNAIAAQAQFVVEKRSVDPGALAAFVERLHGLRRDPPQRVDVEILGERPAGALPRDSPLLATVLEVRRRLGLPETIEAGSTDANAALGLGIPALGLGVSHGRDMHTLGESIDIDSLALGVRQIALVMAALLGGER
jgi:acetylornithine deacetylase/succinyl-diaminopimelate desuccinylase-like protein